MKKTIVVVLILSLIANLYFGLKHTVLKVEAKVAENTSKEVGLSKEEMDKKEDEETVVAVEETVVKEAEEKVEVKKEVPTVSVETTKKPVAPVQSETPVAEERKINVKGKVPSPEMAQMEQDALRLLEQFYLPLVNVVTEGDTLKVLNLPPREEMLAYYAYDLSDRELAKRYIYRLFEEKDGAVYYVPQTEPIKWFDENKPYDFEVVSDMEMKIRQTNEDGSMTFIFKKTDIWRLNDVIEK